jgi:hypothetical protein
MTYRNQQTAEESKDYILNKLNKQLDTLVDVTTVTLSKSINAILINIIVLLIVILVISLMLLAYFKIISFRTAVGVFIIWVLSLFILAIMISIYLASYTRKRLKVSSEIFYNYVSSEDALDLINETAAVYLANV